MGIEQLLRNAGYRAVGKQGSPYAFDVIARKHDSSRTLILKCVEEIRDLSPKTALELKRASKAFDGSVIVVNEGAPGQMEELVQKRYGIPVISPNTFKKMLRGEKLPLIYTSRGGIYVKLRASILRKRRKELGLSLGDVARELGVSRRAVLEYEKGKMDATLNVACKLEELMGGDVIENLTFESLEGITDLSEPATTSGKEVKDEVLLNLLKTLEKLGCKSYVFSKTPFELASKYKSLVKLIVKKLKGEESEDVEELIIDLAEVTGSKAFIITPEGEKEEHEHALIVPFSEFRDKTEDLVRQALEQ